MQDPKLNWLLGDQRRREEPAVAQTVVAVKACGQDRFHWEQFENERNRTA